MLLQTWWLKDTGEVVRVYRLAARRQTLLLGPYRVTCQKEHPTGTCWDTWVFSMASDWPQRSIITICKPSWKNRQLVGKVNYFMFQAERGSEGREFLQHAKILYVAWKWILDTFWACSFKGQLLRLMEVNHTPSNEAELEALSPERILSFPWQLDLVLKWALTVSENINDLWGEII